MRYQQNLSIDRQFNQIRQRDKIIRQLWLLALTLAAIILVLAVMLFAATKAHAIECHSSPQTGTYWSWRQIDGRKCWYQGRHVVPKSQLHWRAAPAENKPIIIDFIKDHRAEALQTDLDANGNASKDECCWPSLKELLLDRWRTMMDQLHATP